MKETSRRGVQFGTTFNESVTIEEAFAKAGANYEVEKQKLIRLTDEEIAKIINGESLTLDPSHIIKSKMATVRSDNDVALGVVGSSYGIAQNTKAMEFIDFMTNGAVGKGEAMVESCGVFDDGGRVYVEVSMPTSCYLDDKREDEIKNKLLFYNSHDGSGAVTCIFTPIRVICNNTLNAALRLSGKKNIGKIIFKHTSGVNERMDFSIEANRAKAIECLKLNERCTEEYIANLLKFKSERFTNADKAALEFATRMNVSDEKMVAEVLRMGSVDNVDIATRTKNNINALLESIHGGIGQNAYEGSKLWLANGITTYYENDYDWKDNNTKIESINAEGYASKQVDKAFDLLTRMAV